MQSGLRTTGCGVYVPQGRVGQIPQEGSLHCLPLTQPLGPAKNIKGTRGASCLSYFPTCHLAKHSFPQGRGKRARLRQGGSYGPETPGSLGKNLLAGSVLGQAVAPAACWPSGGTRVRRGLCPDSQNRNRWGLGIDRTGQCKLYCKQHNGSTSRAARHRRPWSPL